MLTRALVLASSLGCVACASDGGAFLPGDDPGTGTSTLRVIATAVAAPRLANATTGDDLDTTFHVVVDKAGTRVTTGAVTIGSVTGTLALTFDTRDGGAWIGTQRGYQEIYVLDVASGADTVDAVRVDGPDVHVFTAPVAGATVDATMPLAVAWTRVDTAVDAELFTGAARADVPDTGAYTIAVGGLPSAADRPLDEELRLERRATVVPAGATAGSSFELTVRNTTKVVVAPTAPPTDE